MLSWPSSVRRSMRLPANTLYGQASTSGRFCSDTFCLNENSRGRGARLRVSAEAGTVTLLDYGAGNVRSVRNAVKQLGYTLKEVCNKYLISNPISVFIAI